MECKKTEKNKTNTKLIAHSYREQVGGCQKHK